MREKYLGDNLHNMNELDHWFDFYTTVDEMASFAFSQIAVVDRKSFENEGIDVEYEMKMMLRGLEASGDLRIIETSIPGDGVGYALHFVREDQFAISISAFAYARHIGLHKKVRKAYVCDKCGWQREWLVPAVGYEEQFESHAHLSKERKICEGGTFHLVQ